jgi:hypothetical protein
VTIAKRCHIRVARNDQPPADASVGLDAGSVDVALRSEAREDFDMLE